MSTLKAAKCETCDKVEPFEFGSHPESWWIVFGPRGTGQLDFCSRACISHHFRASVASAPVLSESTP